MSLISQEFAASGTSDVTGQTANKSQVLKQYSKTYQELLSAGFSQLQVQTVLKALPMVSADSFVVLGAPESKHVYVHWCIVTI
jgi:hypothetical protein